MADSTLIPGQYIVVFKDQAKGVINSNSNAAQQALERIRSVLKDNAINSDSVLFRYKYALKGFAAKVTPSQVKRLQSDPRVDHVAQARMFQLGKTSLIEKHLPLINSFSSNSTMLSGQTIPWGVTRVYGPLDGTGKKAWIIDTGIDMDNPDLNVDAANSVSFIDGESPDDILGLGTHVAGIVAAKNNNIDVVGVAAGATVIAVKVCDNSGCPEPSLINGIDYVANRASPADIVNMSIWNTQGISSNLDNAVLNAANNDVRFTLIAGNAGDNANNYSPGRVEHYRIRTVSAFDNTDSFASFSNYGNPPIEYSGPGVNIPSLAIGGGITYKSGTSMAAPHIAGLLLASKGISTQGTVSNDPDGNSDPISVATLTVSISGPNTLAKGEQGTWTASVSGGDNNYSYEWYYKSDDTNDQWNGPVSYNDSYSTQMYSFDYYLDIRVDVSDGSGRTGAGIKNVQCSDCGLGGGGGSLSVDN